MNLHRWLHWSWRTRLAVWGCGLLCIAVGPIVQAEMQARQADPLGLRLVEDLDGNAGVAVWGAAAIAISQLVNGNGWPEATELHERAHLLQFAEAEVVGRLLAVVPAAAPGEYASTNRTEHFAEMAGRAWAIVAEPEGFCIEGTPEERLADAERRIPGTAGFVAWYLRHPALAGRPAARSLRALAHDLLQPHRAEWEAVWRAIDTRRLPAGELAPWPVPTIRQNLESQRLVARASDEWVDRIVDVGLVPSLTLLALFGR